MRMNRFVGSFIVIAMALTSCIAGLKNLDQEIQDSPVLLTSTHTPEKPTRDITSTSTLEITTCEIFVEWIVDSAISFAWSYQADSLFFSQDPEKLVWREYPDQNKSVDLQSVFPILQGQVIDAIQYSGNTYPAYSISPSGEKVVFWEKAYTKPTPTPAAGEVSLTEFEWLLDLYLFTMDVDKQRLVTRVEGEIVDVYWSRDEAFVYLLFDQLQIPGDYFLVQVDLIQGDKKVILPNIQGQRYDNWIALSPNDSFLTYRYRDDPTTAYMLNLDTGEEDQVGDLPDFDILLWAKDDLWILVNNSNDGAIFIVFDSYSHKIIDKHDFSERVGILSGLNKPILSPYDNKIAFFGTIDPKTNTPSLYTISLCESD